MQYTQQSTRMHAGMHMPAGLLVQVNALQAQNMSAEYTRQAHALPDMSPLTHSWLLLMPLLLHKLSGIAATHLYKKQRHEGLVTL